MHLSLGWPIVLVWEHDVILLVEYKLDDVLLQGGYLMARLVKNTLENFASYETAEEMESFFEGKENLCLHRSISQAIESIRLNAAWLARDRQSISDFLRSHS